MFSVSEVGKNTIIISQEAAQYPKAAEAHGGAEN